MAISTEVMLAGKFLTESLTIYDPEITKTVYPQYWGYEGLYHRAIPNLPLGAQSMVSSRMDFTGRAVNFGGKATTLPLANVGMQMDAYKTIRGILAADWTWEELITEKMAKTNPMYPQVDVVASYRMALEKGLREWMHLKAVFGDPSIGFQGLFTNMYVEVIDVSAAANGVTGTGATAATAYEWFRTNSSDFRKNTKLTAEQTVAFVSEDIRAALQKRYADTSSDGTPFVTLTSRTESPSLRKIITLNECDGTNQRDSEWGNLAKINNVTLPAGNTYDFVLFTDASFATNAKRRFADITTLPVGLLDDQMTYRLVGLCATSEVVYEQPYLARMYIMRKS